ncbi:MAG: hypothetical protein ABW076_15220 [Candidatus Thiodiazotropha sp.]
MHIYAIYLILLLMLVGALSASYLLQGTSWWIDNLGANLSTEVAGILITLLIVERLLKMSKDEEEKKKAKPAYQKIYQSMKDVVELAEFMIKAASTAPVEKQPKSAKETFSEARVSNLRYLDFTATGHMADANWGNISELILGNAKIQIHDAFDLYIAFLPSEYVSAINEVIEHPFFSHWFNTYKAVDNIEYRAAIYRTQQPNLWEKADHFAQPFFKSLIKAVEIHNKLSDTKIPVGADWLLAELGPGVGTGRWDKCTEQGAPADPKNAGAF